MTHLDVEYESGSAGAEAAAVAKFSDDRWELNVRAPASEFLTLRDIRTFAWDRRNVARVGSCAGASVFWCSDGQTATIMVGQDDESWDVAVLVPVEVVDDLVRQMERRSL
ncbi:MAG: hypothetical protein ABIR39_05695 [Nocardioides sp.]|uniref:hypothetical protein n=1 Tax=Nocardioides sp. TaxID=35761 RepID=UPI0032662085